MIGQRVIEFYKKICHIVPILGVVDNDWDRLRKMEYNSDELFLQRGQQRAGSSLFYG